MPALQSRRDSLVDDPEPDFSDDDKLLEASDEGYDRTGQGEIDLEAVSPAFRSSDPVTQNEIFSSITNPNARNTLRDDYESIFPKPITLTQLKGYYERDNNAATLSLLQQRRQVEIDNAARIELRNTYLSITGHFLDSLVAVPAEMGLWAILPRDRHLGNWSISLDLHKPRVEYWDKDGHLGFDSAGKMLRFVNFRREEGWFVWIPASVLEEGLGASQPTPKGSRSTCLSPRHYRMTVMFLSEMLTLALPDRGFICHPYGSVADDRDTLLLDGKAPEWSIYTNVMQDRRPIELTLPEIRSVHEMMIAEYQNWVNAAPAHWKEDGFLQNHRPAAITKRFGQNEPINVAPEMEERQWDNDRHWERMSYVTFALATHFEAREVRQWTAVPWTDISSKHSVIYDSSDLLERKPIADPEHCSLVDEHGIEIRFFSEAGARIQRRGALCEPQIAGMMLNLRDIDELYTSCGDGSRPTVNLYPAANLRDYGYIQANTVMRGFQEFLPDLNRRLALVGVDHNEYADEDVDIDGPEENDRNLTREDMRRANDARAITEISSQVYSELAHRTARRAGDHDVQSGKASACAAGLQSEDAKARDKAHMLFTQLRNTLPHQDFLTKLQHPDIPKDLRAENVFKISLKKLPPERRRGSAIFRDIMVPLAQHWANPAVTDDLKSKLLVLGPEYFPGAYLYTSFPVTLLTEQLWHAILESFAASTEISPYMVELLALCERLLAYNYTGNPRVLTKGVMHPLYTSRSLIKHGLPTIRSGIYKLASPGRPLVIQTNSWPAVGNTTAPAMASEATQVKHFTRPVFQLYSAGFRMAFLSNHDTSRWTMEVPEPERRRCILYAEIALTALKDDVRNLVRDGVDARIDQAEEDTGDLERDLDYWCKQQDLLSLQPGPFQALVRLVNTDATLLAHGLPGTSTNRMSVDAMAEELVKMGDGTIKHPRCPVVAKGVFYPTLRVAVRYIKRSVPATVDATEYARQVSAQSFPLLKIHHLPWSAPKRVGPGRQSTKPVYEHWLSLGAEDARRRPRRIELGNETQQGLHAAQIAAVASDVNAEWTLKTFSIRNAALLGKRASLPSDFEVELQGASQDIRNIVTWVKGKYDYKDEAHRLCMLMGIAVSHMCPDLFPPAASDTKALLKGCTDIASTMRVITGLSWETRSRGGLNTPHLIASMVTIYAIAHLEPESPLHVYRESPAKATDWYSKFSHKGINALMLCRLGLAQGKGVVMASSPKLDMHWNMLSRKVLKQRWLELVQLIERNAHFGPADFYTTVFGQTKGEAVAKRLLHPVRAAKRAADEHEGSETARRRMNE